VKLRLKTRAIPRHCRRQQGGYAILLVLFLATLMLLSTMAVAPNILTEGKRQKEEEMIWRGKQYTRGIKLFYRKTGKFPTSMDDLVKPKLGNIRFMRQPYKDPMNPKDGEWRLIYVGPSGQLIGSLKPAHSIQLSGMGGAIGGVPGTPAAQVGAQSQSIGAGLGQAVGQAFGNSSAGSATLSPGTSNPNGQPNSPNGEPASADSQAADANGTAAAASDAASEALLAAEPTTVMGGNIIGVGSKINQRSIIVYEKAKNYKQFEFIWDPAKDTITIGGAAGPQIGTPVGQPGQSSPFGTSTNPNGPGSPMNPDPSPPETTPAPPPPQP
jgi:hypothetical protein